MSSLHKQIRMTQYSHGSGCGCKIAPGLLKNILQSRYSGMTDPRLLVGNDSHDDAAVYDLGNGTSVISTTDFFMPVVDDPFEFGQMSIIVKLPYMKAQSYRQIHQTKVY